MFGAKRALAAARQGDAASVEEFINMAGRERAATIRDEWGNSMLHYACNGGHLDLVAMLMGCSCDPNDRSKDGIAPIHLAAHGGHAAVITHLVEHGASATAQDGTDRTPGQLAADAGHVDCVRLLAAHDPAARALLDRVESSGSGSSSDNGAGSAYDGGANGSEHDTLGPEPDVASGDGDGGGRTVAQPDGLGPEPEPVAVSASVAAAADADVSGKAAAASHARLVAACAAGDAAAVATELSMPKPPDLGAVTADGDAAVHAAVRAGHISVFRTLVIHGASPFQRTSPGERTCLHVAAEAGHADAAVALVREFGLTLGAVDRDGMTAIHVAAELDHSAVAKRLLWAQGGSLGQLAVVLDAADAYGATAADVAEQSGHDECAGVLQRHRHMCRVVDAGAGAQAVNAEYVDSTLKQEAFKGIEDVFRAFVAAESGSAPRDHDACERHLLVLRLFLAGTECKRRRVQLPRLPEDTVAEAGELAADVLAMLSAEREACGAAPGDAALAMGAAGLGAVDHARECKATLVAESCVYAARAVAEAYECAGVLMLGIASDWSTTHGRDMARLHVVRQVAQGALSEADAGEVLHSLEELEAFSNEIDKMGPEPSDDADAKQGKDRRKWGSSLWSKSVKSLREIVRAKDDSGSGGGSGGTPPRRRRPSRRPRDSSVQQQAEPADSTRRGSDTAASDSAASPVVGTSVAPPEEAADAEPDAAASDGAAAEAENSTPDGAGGCAGESAGEITEPGPSDGVGSGLAWADAPGQAAEAPVEAVCPDDWGLGQAASAAELGQLLASQGGHDSDAPAIDATPDSAEASSGNDTPTDEIESAQSSGHADTPDNADDTAAVSSAGSVEQTDDAAVAIPTRAAVVVARSPEVTTTIMPLSAVPVVYPAAALSPELPTRSPSPTAASPAPPPSSSSSSSSGAAAATTAVPASPTAPGADASAAAAASALDDMVFKPPTSPMAPVAMPEGVDLASLLSCGPGDGGAGNDGGDVKATKKKGRKKKTRTGKDGSKKRRDPQIDGPAHFSVMLPVVAPDEARGAAVPTSAPVDNTAAPAATTTTSAAADAPPHVASPSSKSVFGKALMAKMSESLKRVGSSKSSSSASSSSSAATAAGPTPPASDATTDGGVDDAPRSGRSSETPPTPASAGPTTAVAVALNDAARYVGEDHLKIDLVNAAYPSTAKTGPQPPADAGGSIAKIGELSPPVTVVVVCPPDGAYGVEFFPGGSAGGVVVQEVARGGAADLAGMCAGDTLLAVNGADASVVTLARVLDEMHDKRARGAPIRFEVSRAAAARAKTRAMYRREGAGVKLISIPKIRGIGGMGLTLTMTPTERDVLVTDVVAGGAADNAGLAVDDVVVAAAGRPVADFKNLIEVLKFLKMLKDTGGVALRVERRSSLAKRLHMLKESVVHKEKNPLAGAPAWWKDGKPSAPTALAAKRSPAASRQSK